MQEEETKGGIPEEIRTCLEQLGFLSMIKERQKPCFNSLCIVDADSWSSYLYRRFYRESPTLVNLHIKQYLENAFDVLQRHKQSKYATAVKVKLQKVIPALENLAKTYKRNKWLVAQLDVHEESIRIELDKLEKKAH